MGRTRLFQAAGSPLIQGHSRTERSFFADWSTSVISAVLTAAVAMTVWGVLSENIFHGGWIDAVFEVVHMSVLLFGPGALAGCAIGVWLGRRYGASHPWRVGWLFGVICGVLAVWAEISAFGVLFGASNA